MNATERKINKKEVKIRRMVRSDIPSILSISWANLPKKKIVASQLGGPLDLSLIAEFEGILVGFVLARLIYASLPIKGAGTILYIAVKPNYQGCGISSILIDNLKRDCKAKGIEALCSFIPEHNTEAVKYFEKVGFRRSSIVNYLILV